MSKKPTDIRTFFLIKEPVNVLMTDEKNKSDCEIKPSQGCSKSCYSVRKQTVSITYFFDGIGDSSIKRP